MTNVTEGKRPNSFLLGPALSRLSAKIAPLVIDEIVGALITKLERHLNEQLLPDLHAQMEGIVTRELQERVEAIVARELPERIEAIVDQVLPAKQSQFYRPNNIVAGSIAGEYMSASNVVARDFLHREYAEFCGLLKASVGLHRKPWEWAFIYDRLHKAGVLRSDMRGLGFGVGVERLPSLFASMGVRVTATDSPRGGDWEAGGVYASDKEKLFYSDTISRESFEDRVSFEFCDMNEIPSQLTDFDFCWSSCAFEHLGTLQNGLDFVINSIERTLKVGGIACHTTELNLSSEDDTIDTGVTVLYRKKDLEQLCKTLENRGHWVEPLRIEPGTLPPDYSVDVPPYRSGWHLKLLVGSYVTTSVGLVARRGR
jgi:hypothetical protein